MTFIMHLFRAKGSGNTACEKCGRDGDFTMENRHFFTTRIDEWEAARFTSVPDYQGQGIQCTSPLVTIFEVQEDFE